ESGLRSDDVRGRSYSLRDRTPVVRVNHNRHGCSVISTVTNRGEMRWMVFKGGLNAQVLTKFLTRLIKNAPGKIFLVLDNLRVHQCKRVAGCLNRREQIICTFVLPSYSPELNPSELAKASLKQAVTSHAPARKKGHIERVASTHLRHLQLNPSEVSSFFQTDT